MNIEVLKNAGIDYDGGVRRFVGRAQLFLKTLSKFPRNDTMARVRAAFASKDLEALLRDAHEMKGMCGNMSMPRLSNKAGEIVTLLRSGEASEADLAAAMDALEAEYEIAKEAVLKAMEESE